MFSSGASVSCGLFTAVAVCIVRHVGRDLSFDFFITIDLCARFDICFVHMRIYENVKVKNVVCYKKLAVNNIYASL